MRERRLRSFESFESFVGFVGFEGFEGFKGLESRVSFFKKQDIREITAMSALCVEWREERSSLGGWKR